MTVTVERAGQKQEITLNIAQVAAQATRELDGEANPAAGAGNGAAQQVPNPTTHQMNSARASRMRSIYRVLMMPTSTRPQPKPRIAAVVALSALLLSVSLPAAPQAGFRTVRPSPPTTRTRT